MTSSGETPTDYFRVIVKDARLGQIRLFERIGDTIEFLVPDQKHLRRSTPWHWGLHARNLYDEDNQITGIIDWQDLVQYHGEIMLELLNDYEDMPAGEERMSIEAQVEKSLVLWYYENETKSRNVVLYELFQWSQQIISFATSDKINDFPLRECLIQLKRQIATDAPRSVTANREQKVYLVPSKYRARLMEQTIGMPEPDFGNLWLALFEKMAGHLARSSMNRMGT
ncbi:hypothetical protein K461DRAFT_267078 [Myriangium duriaei CBS 260.36]|uniref:Aminoglycoside phosphotransferase domain-containing protein n=1 Tax=Myriangium duriaei CBS 260.36 TaxID=1168546 RepID=A0A9P4J1Z3_9PEZI|nr:hypothetical protein K461DRAFT_267078 [Myriangium duriaei CBS 260.36]